MTQNNQHLSNEYNKLIMFSNDLSSAIRNFVKVDRLYDKNKDKINSKERSFYNKELSDFLEQIVLNLDETFSITKKYYSLEFYQKLLSDFSVLSRHYRIDEKKEKFPSYIDQGLKNQLLNFNYQLLSYIFTFNPKLFADSDSKTLIAIDYKRFYNTLVKD